ncbi:MAG: hypothetical protein A2W11_06150 [Ignavibacteria bacterium RBG_16_35_7]|nr:MAG: hypothetical protein A2W11_06150 [Ignavibacteria bacterium RBG_16_35_7]
MKVSKTIILELDFEEIEMLKKLVLVGNNKYNDCIRKELNLNGLSFSEMQNIISFSEIIGDL